MDTTAGVFETLGIGASEERIYEALLRDPSSSTGDLSRSLGLSTDRVTRGLSLLREKGFVTETAGRPRRYLPAPPEGVVEVLALKREEELQEARMAAARLAQLHREGAEKTQPGDLLEVAAGSSSVAQRFLQFQQTARNEVLIIDRPPYASPPNGRAEVDRERQMIERGVRIRAIYSREALEIPGRLSLVHELVGLGEEARVLTDVSTKLVIVDRKVGLVPLDFERPGIEDAVLIHASFLLHALTMLFDSLWEKAIPLEPHGSGTDSEDDRAQRDDLLRLLAAGLQDESIARALHMSRSTVARRMRELMEELGAKTRFQTGFLAARRLDAVEARGD